MAEDVLHNYTFLFTAIEGCGQRWEQHPTAMPAALDRQLAIAQRVVAAHAGRIFQVISDQLCVAFAEPAAGVAAAADLQRAVAAEDWSAVGGLSLKIALNSGLAQERGDDYFAPHIFNRIARTLAVARGGQVLVCAATAEALSPLEYELRDLGARELRDLPPQHIYQLLAPGLRDDFPPFEEVAHRPHNLPAPMSSFIGREAEVASLRDLLRRPAPRLLTLTGSGGVGKTRLALTLAASLIDEFDDGVYFVPLASVSQPEQVATHIARTLGLSEKASITPAVQLAVYLRDKRLLLVLDNFEQVTAAAELLADLVAACPRLKLLVTSRATLRLAAEQTYPVPPLPLPEGDDMGIAQLEQYPAIMLFGERARNVQSDFALTAANAAAVVAICARIDGLPLAIELAASRVKVLPVQHIAARLTAHLDLLQSAVRNQATRHQSLRETLRWSYELLTAEEQQLFRRLAIFQSGWTDEAAIAICSDSGLLTDLVEKSLITVAQTSVGPRYGMLTTIREYAAELLAGSDEAEAVAARHADYYLAFAEAAHAGLSSDAQVVWLDRLRAEDANLRTAFRWLLAQHEAEPCLRMAAALWYYWHTVGSFSLGRELVAAALAQAGDAPPGLRSDVLNGTANLAMGQADYAAARTYFDAAVSLDRSSGSPVRLARTLANMANLMQYKGDYETARRYLEEAIDIQRELADATVYTTVNSLAAVLHSSGDFATALRLLEENLHYYRSSRQDINIVWTLLVLANVSYGLGDFEQALAQCQESLNLAVRLGNDYEANYCRSTLALIQIALGSLAMARSNLQLAIAGAQQLGDVNAVTECVEYYAKLLLHEAAWERAASLFAAAAQSRDRQNTPHRPVEQQMVNDWLAELQTHLPATTYEACWQQGQAMTLAQAAAQVVQDQPATPLLPGSSS